MIVVPARIGPYALSATSGDGELIIRRALGIDLETMALTLTINELPMGVDGIPLQLRRVNIEIDRPEFIRDPTVRCNGYKCCYDQCGRVECASGIEFPGHELWFARAQTDVRCQHIE